MEGLLESWHFLISSKDKKKIEDTLYKFADDSFELHYSIVESTYLFAYLMDNKMQNHYEKK